MNRQRKGIIAALPILVGVAFTILGCSATSTLSQPPTPASPESIIAATSPTTPPVPKLMFLTDTSKPTLTIFASTAGYEFKSRIDLGIDLDAVAPQDVKNELSVYTGLYFADWFYHHYSRCGRVHTFYSEPTIVKETTSLHVRSLPPSLSLSPDVTVCGYEENEPITISVINPFGKVVLRVEALADFTCFCDGIPTHCCKVNNISEFDFLPGDPLGKYTVEILGKDTRLVHTFDLLDLAEPTIYYSNRLGSYIAAGYAPFERVRVLAYKHGQFAGESKLTLDENGIGLLTVGDREIMVFMVREDLDFVVAKDTSCEPSRAWGWVLEPLDYDKIIELDPTNAHAYYQRGRFDQYDLDDRIADFTQAIELDADYLPAYYERGKAYFEQGNYDQAIADYTRAIELDPCYAPAYNNRGWAYYEQGEYDRNIADCTRAIEIDPNYAFAYYNRGVAYSEQGNYDQAIADLERFLELSTDEYWRKLAEQLIREMKGE